MNKSIYRFAVGKVECIALLDAITQIPPEALMESVNIDNTVELELAKYRLKKGEAFPCPYTCLFINTGSQRVLVDTGIGDLSTPKGKLMDCLLEAGLKPEDINIVVISHAHGDHIGGNIDQNGKITFPNAQWVIGKEEWEFWSNPENLKDLPPYYTEVAQQKLLPLSERLIFVAGETEITPGIFIIPFPGHTPGHLVIAVRSEGQELLYSADAMLHPLHVDHPEWFASHWADLIWDGVINSRRALYERAASNHSLVLAFHFAPFPSLGHIERSGEGWRWASIGTG